MTYVTTPDGRLFVDVRGEPVAPPVLYRARRPGDLLLQLHAVAGAAAVAVVPADLVSRVAAARG